MTEIIYTVPDMSCKTAVSSALREVPGVESVDVDLETKLATVRGPDLDDAALRAAIEAVGYEAAEKEKTMATATAGTGQGHSAELRLDLEGMTCASCAARVEKRLNKLESVEATVNFATEQATVRVRSE